jgi:hypothetical protein
VGAHANVVFQVGLGDDVNLTTALTIAWQRHTPLRVPAHFSGSDDPTKVALLWKALAAR